MLKTLKDKWPLLALAGVGMLSLSFVVGLLKTTDAFQSPEQARIESIQTEESAVLRLASLPAEERERDLLKIAQNGSGLERDRARYMLATDYLNADNPKQALPLLDGLESSYRNLASYVLLRRGQAQLATGQKEQAIDTWTTLTERYPESAATAEALYQLGLPADDQTVADPRAWAALLEKFPAHPLSVNVAFRRLGKIGNKANDPAALPLLKNIAYHGQESSQYVPVLNRLVSQYSSSLTPADWAAIGFGYWETQNYGKAGDAYAKAPGTPRTQYRAARGKERAGKTKEAVLYYKQLNATFPDHPETASGLLNLARLQDDQSAIATLDDIIARFPDRAGDALAQRAEILEEKLKSPDSAKQARASILSQYSSSPAAAKIRFKQAKENAKASNYSAAISWAKQLVDASPQDDLAAETGFWLGKWQLRANQPDEARKSFEQVIREHPESYYAWRSAIYLDWNVGNFDTVRSFQPRVTLPEQRTPLPTGSPALQELYLIGHNQTAWSQWQSEFINLQLPTVSEQFTDGIVRLGVGDNLEGIFMVSSLSWRDDPNEIAEYEALKRKSTFWQAIYPFPFPDLILGWAQERELNPLLVTALVRQESRFEPDIQSVVGAVGLMQVMPETGEWISAQIGQDDYTLSKPADNVKFGTWYLDFTHSTYNDNSLYAVASYNAGPGAVSRWIEEKDFTNADEFVEQIPYPETKGYVESVFGGYWNYLRLYDSEVAAKINAL